MVEQERNSDDFEIWKHEIWIHEKCAREREVRNEPILMYKRQVCQRCGEYGQVFLYSTEDVVGLKADGDGNLVGEREEAESIVPLTEFQKEQISNGNMIGPNGEIVESIPHPITLVDEKTKKEVTIDIKTQTVIDNEVQAEDDAEPEILEEAPVEEEAENVTDTLEAQLAALSKQIEELKAARRKEAGEE